MHLLARGNDNPRKSDKIQFYVGFWKNDGFPDDVSYMSKLRWDNQKTKVSGTAEGP
jgi:hypothetical protein